MQNNGDHMRTQGKVSRRGVLRVAALASAAWASQRASARAELPVTRAPGTPLAGSNARSKFVHLELECGAPFQPETSCDILVAINSTSPLQGLYGTITPSDLFFERSHAGTPTIDPNQHRLMVHGRVARPLLFTMDDIMRMPSISRVHFIECSGNGGNNWQKLIPTLTVQQSHGLISTAEWTGVPLSVILEQVGVDAGARWMLAEGADGAAVDRSIPLTPFIRQNAILAYAQNGEPLRPANGYPLRLIVPGFEGNANIKWLRRLKFGTQPFMTRWETDRYTRLRPNGKAEQFVLVQGVNSVITSPSGGMHTSNGYVEIRGLAWSGHGKIAKVEVSEDGGKSWAIAPLQDPVLRQAQTRFRLPWTWNGQPALLQSRATDEVGNVQPTRKHLIEQVGPSAFYHYNGIQTWKIDASGNVTNAFA